MRPETRLLKGLNGVAAATKLMSTGAILDFRDLAPMHVEITRILVDADDLYECEKVINFVARKLNVAYDWDDPATYGTSDWSSDFGLQSEADDNNTEASSKSSESWLKRLQKNR
jgi:hypothetical protein